MADNRRIITWSMKATSDGYRRDIKNYHNKIYSIGLHEFGVRDTGKIYNYRTNEDYFNGGHTGTYMPIENENDMIDYPGIKWFVQPIIFGWEKVSKILDSSSAQSTFLSDLRSLLDLYSTSRYSGTPLNIHGVEMDVEAVVPSDAEDGYDVKYLKFLERIKNEVCSSRGLKLRVNAYAMWGTNTPYYYRFHNYKLFAQSSAIDEVQIMTYDFAWSGSAPGASTPIWWFREVGEWIVECFGAFGAKNVFMGAAGYGKRWGIFDDNNWGATVTYRQLLGWQNGYYRHYHNDGGVYYYHDQEYLQQCGFEDALSNNQMMFQHVYDFGRAKYANIIGTGYLKSFNKKEYITTYSRYQQPQFTNVLGVTAEAVSAEGAVETYDSTIKIGEDEYPAKKYVPRAPQETGELDPETGEPILDEQGNPVIEPPALVTYKLDAPAGTHRLVAYVYFGMLEMCKLGGTFNGSALTIGDINVIGEHYPLWQKFHFVDLGEHSFSGNDEIIINGEMCDYGTQIIGFIVCDGFEHGLMGGEIVLDVNPQPFITKDKIPARIPSEFAISCEVLRSNARPAVIFDDRFGSYKEAITGSYYVDPTGWLPGKDGDDRSCVSRIGAGELVLNHVFKSNIQLEAEFCVNVGETVGLKFGGTYTFEMDYIAMKVVLKNNGVIIEQNDLSNTFFWEGTTRMRVRVHDGKGYFYIGLTDTNAFGDGVWFDINVQEAVEGVPESGNKCGFFIDNTDVKLYYLGVGSLDKWEPMEKFVVEVDGQITELGEVERTVQYDEWGYLDYSGVDELSTWVDIYCEDRNGGLPKDYLFKVAYVNGFKGKKQIKVKIKDAGIWFANAYVGDKEGCSITYAGDAGTFGTLMNIATSDYGVKGIGLWVMGYEDPRIFELVPDVTD